MYILHIAVGRLLPAFRDARIVVSVCKIHYLALSFVLVIQVQYIRDSGPSGTESNLRCPPFLPFIKLSSLNFSRGRGSQGLPKQQPRPLMSLYNIHPHPMRRY